MRFTCVALLSVAGCIARVPFDQTRVIDLTYPLNEESIFWPTARGFELSPVAYGLNAQGLWYASNDICLSEHGGTHLDAPIHFAQDGRTTAGIPISQLMGPARAIDIRRECEADRDYLLSPADIERHERRYGPIEPGTIVLVRTGFGRYYPDAKRFFGE